MPGCQAFARRSSLALAAGLTTIALAGPPRPLAAQAARLTIVPAHPAPGSVARLSLRTAPGAEPVAAITGTMAGEPLHFASAGKGVWHAIGPVPVDASTSVGALAIIVYGSGAVDTVRASAIVPAVRPPKSQPLAVDSQFSRPLDAATEARVARENERARDVARRAHDAPPRWSQPFRLPRATVVTSSFGSGRVFNGALTTRHLGVDFRGAVGEPIRAANRGIVALVDTFFLAGTVVYIDHGGGVVTGYFHMSKALVAARDTVARGQEIGLVGATGRVTGAHLHWSARYGAVTVDPMGLVALDPAWLGLRPASPAKPRPSP